MGKDILDIYNDEGECIGKDLPAMAFHPLLNPYMNKIAQLCKTSSFINLPRLEKNIKRGLYGEMTAIKQDEIQMDQYIRDWDIVRAAEDIVKKIKKKITIGNGGKFSGTDVEVNLIGGGKIIHIKLPKKLLDVSASVAPLYTIPGIALGQSIAEIYDVNPMKDPDGATLIKSAIFGRYPQTLEFGSNCPIFTLLKPPHREEGCGTLFKSQRINNMVALANYRTFDAVALTTIFEQLAQLEMANNLGWFKRYHVLGTVYQGFNANNLVLDLIKENADGTVGDVVRNLMKRAYKDGVVYKPSNSYPDVQPSGYVLYKTKDYALWNAYSCAGLLAACCVNIGASRAAQGVSAVLGIFGDMLSFESGGLPDPDAGRIMGTGLGFSFYTHSIYGGAGPGAFTMDHVIVRHSSGFFTPCAAAGMCLDAGTQVFSPKLTSSGYFLLRKEFKLLQDPVEKTVEAAKQIKDKV
ncbi:MAG: methyl-coenzyme M reductase subunit beta [Candidatus Lokiarchaeota archaeon]|nr:methyl-coenzyme M reductase subunit beta [Candidatus Lokiarchaeota archaeon]